MRFSALVFLAACVSASAQRPDLSRIDDRGAWQVQNGETQMESIDGRSALQLRPIGGNRKGSNAAIAAPEGVTMANGAIDVDLKGNGEDPGFVGVAFNVSDPDHYEAVYFRPFNFRTSDAERRAHAVQYVAWPQYTWEGLRKGMPGQYESGVAPVPDPAGWFHARIEVSAADVKVFVDRAQTPCLVVRRLVPSSAAKVGLFVDSQQGWFADLTIAPN